MISLLWVFYLMVIFFALIGSIRGWQREVLALAGLIGSIAALIQFGHTFIEPLVRILPPGEAALADPTQAARRVVIVQAIFHSTIAFFSYQVVARLADTATGGRIGERVREGFQKRFIGGILGAVNGYLLVGGLWSFLEYQLQPGGYVPLLQEQGYVFDPNVISRPEIGTAARALVPYLPLGLVGPAWWLLFFFIAFFIVIIALI